jgi:hypothetical protein
MLSGLLEVVLQPVLELVLRVAGYITGYVAVPVFTLGRVLVEPDSKKQVVFPSGGGIKRRDDGVYIMDAELGALFGLVFWLLVGVSIFVYRART